MATSAVCPAQTAKEKSASTSGAPRIQRHPDCFTLPDGMQDLLLGSLHVAIGTEADGVTEGNVVEATSRIVRVNGDTERNSLARSQHSVTSQLAGKGHRVGVTVLGAFGGCTSLTAFHVALVGNETVNRLAATTPLQQVHGTCGNVLGLVLALRHALGIFVTGSPAADLVAQRHLVVREHDGGLDFIILVGVIETTGRRLEGQANVQVVRIVGSLHGDRVGHGLRRALRFHFLAGQTLQVQAQLAVFNVAASTGFTFFQAAGAAVVTLALHPFKRCSTRVENVDGALANLVPIRRSQCCLGAESHESASNGEGNDFVDHPIHSAKKYVTARFQRTESRTASYAKGACAPLALPQIKQSAV